MNNHWLSSELSQRIRRKIVAGSLPADPQTPANTGMGQGVQCVCCERPVEDFNFQRTLELPGTAAERTLAMHDSCFDLWRETAVDVMRQRSQR